MASLPASTLTEDQYLCIEREAATKSEFFDGQVFAMAGGSLNHSLLANRIGAILDRHLPPECRAFNSDLRIKVAAAGLYTYADCGVLCSKPQFHGKQQDCLLNPLLIVEVLSPSTEGYDRGKKFELYRTIDSFREYLIVHQDRPHVEHYSKQDDGSWLLREHSGAEDWVVLTRLGARFSLADIYAPTLNLG